MNCFLTARDRQKSGSSVSEAIMMVWQAVICLAAALIPAQAAQLGCVGQAGQPVDWYIALKAAGKGSHGSDVYAWLDSSRCALVAPGHQGWYQT